MIEEYVLGIRGVDLYLKSIVNFMGLEFTTDPNLALHLEFEQATKLRDFVLLYHTFSLRIDKLEYTV